jgi:hypothetical protein
MILQDGSIDSNRQYHTVNQYPLSLERGILTGALTEKRKRRENVLTPGERGKPLTNGKETWVELKAEPHRQWYSKPLPTPLTSRQCRATR